MLDRPQREASEERLQVQQHSARHTLLSLRQTRVCEAHLHRGGHLLRAGWGCAERPHEAVDEVLHRRGRSSGVHDVQGERAHVDTDDTDRVVHHVGLEDVRLEECALADVEAWEEAGAARVQRRVEVLPAPGRLVWAVRGSHEAVCGGHGREEEDVRVSNSSLVRYGRTIEIDMEKER